MTSIGTAELKAHLSEHLRAVRRGESILVLDRREAIARIVPVTDVDLVIRPAIGSLHDVPLLESDPTSSDVLHQLYEERAERL